MTNVAALSTSLFMDINNLLFGDSIPPNIFDLLGGKLEQWITNRLDSIYEEHQSKANSDKPIILGEVDSRAVIEGRVVISKGAKVEPFAMIQGPCFIGPGSQVRHGAYIRGQVYVGKDCVVGHTTEVKGSCFFDGAKAGHFAYIGNSILGRNVNLGAGTKLANLKLAQDLVSYRHPEDKKRYNSGLKKFGAILGDEAQTGCNSVLSPGSILMPKTLVYPCVHHHGTLTKGVSR